jgi:hypothetical protein
MKRTVEAPENGVELIEMDEVIFLVECMKTRTSLPELMTQ